MANVTMPQLGETVADGTVTKWFKKVGDTVVKGEPLFEVSTDKVDTEIPSPTNGILTAILVDEGVTVDVGTVLAVIGDGSEEPATTVPRSSATPTAKSRKYSGHQSDTQEIPVRSGATLSGRSTTHRGERSRPRQYLGYGT